MLPCRDLLLLNLLLFQTLEEEIVLMKGDGAKYMNALKDVLLRIQPLFPPPKVEQPEEVKTEETPKVLT